MFTEQEKFDKAVGLVKKFCPNYTVSLKKDSKIHRAIGWILGKIGNKAYMTNYVTTLGQSTALPGDGTVHQNMWQSILHEGIHAVDSKRTGNWLFGASYLLPQLIGVAGLVYIPVVALALLLGGPLWLLWGLVALLFLAPLPAPYRTYAEVRGYTVSLAVAFWSNTLGDAPAFIEAMVEVFAKWGYYKTWPFKEWVRWWFNKKLLELKINAFHLDPYFAACKTLSVELKD